MKLLLLNPNTSEAMTAPMTAAAHTVAAPATSIVGRQPGFGPASIESRVDEVFAAAGVAEQLRLSVQNSEHFDAAVVA